MRDNLRRLVQRMAGSLHRSDLRIIVPVFSGMKGGEQVDFFRSRTLHNMSAGIHLCFTQILATPFFGTAVPVRFRCEQKAHCFIAHSGTIMGNIHIPERSTMHHQAPAPSTGARGD